VTAEVPHDERLPLTIVLGRERVVVDGTRLQPADPVAFELDEADLLPQGRAAVADLAGWLKDHDDVQLLSIEGHADASGTSRHNLELSRARAEAVRALLVELGVDGERLEAIGTGEARPDRDGDDGSRRVEFLVLVRDEPGDLTPE
jgi:outer membrane protein OmpA-like peptidoglycan-associated protein